MSTDASLLRSWTAELAAVEQHIRIALSGVFAVDAVRRVEADAVAIAEDLLKRAGFDPEDPRFLFGYAAPPPLPAEEPREEEHTDELLTVAVSSPPLHLESELELELELEPMAVDDLDLALNGAEPAEGWITYDEAVEEPAPPSDAPPQADLWVQYEDEQPTNPGVASGPKTVDLTAPQDEADVTLDTPPRQPEAQAPPPARPIPSEPPRYLTHADEEDDGDVMVHDEGEEEITGIFSRPPPQTKPPVRPVTAQFQADVDSAVTLDTEQEPEESTAVPVSEPAIAVVAVATPTKGAKARNESKRTKGQEIDEFELVVDDGDAAPITEDEADDASDAEVVQSSAAARANLSSPAGRHGTGAAVRAGGHEPALPRVGAKVPGAAARATAGLYGSAAVPTIRDSQDPRPKAAAIQINAAAGSSKVLGLEEEEEPLEIGSAEDYGEEEPDHEPVSGGGFRVNLQEYEEVEIEAEVEPEEAEAADTQTGPIGFTPPAQTGPSAAEIESMLARARAAEEGGLLDDGISLYADVLDADPDNIDARVGRGRLYLDRGDFARAMSDFMVAEEIGPQHPEPQIAIGDLHFARKDYRKAIDYFDLALSLAPKSGKAYCRRGISHYWRKAYPQALADLATAQKLDPETPNIGTYITMVKKKMKK